MLKTEIFAYYSGKVVDMGYLPPHIPPKQRFSLACARVLDNAKSGYVLDGEKVYYLSPASRLAKIVSGEERERVRAEIATLRAKE